MQVLGRARVGLGVWFVLIGMACAEPLFANPEQAAPGKSKGTNAAQSASSESPPSAANKQSKAVTPVTASTSSDAEKDKFAYRIGVEDELLISVWREPNLTLEVVVRPDGMISMPLLNDVMVVDLTPMELQTALTYKLKDFVKEPLVTVIVRRIRSRKVYLFGQVVRQGAFPLNGKTTVLQLLAEAGGFGPFAKPDSVHILRKAGENQIRIPFRYKDAIKGRNGTDMVLLPGDVVMVP